MAIAPETPDDPPAFDEATDRSSSSSSRKCCHLRPAAHAPGLGASTAMKGAIASVEIFVFDPGPAASRAAEAGASDSGSPGRPRRLSLVVGLPERVPGSAGWQCRVALADLHRPEVFEGRDSAEALLLAVARAKTWLAALAADGHRLTRDRAGTEPFAAPFLS